MFKNFLMFKRLQRISVFYSIFLRLYILLLYFRLSLPKTCFCIFFGFSKVFLIIIKNNRNKCRILFSNFLHSTYRSFSAKVSHNLFSVLEIGWTLAFLKIFYLCSGIQAFISAHFAVFGRRDFSWCFEIKHAGWKIVEK